ncbi:MAG: cytochrome c(L), periplasmic [Proteobacteria bacterium]|nr:cytochrome c(L), periplasmic [Pseudomonadota bacterium]
MDNKISLKNIAGFFFVALITIIMILFLVRVDAQMVFRNTVTGEELDFSFAKPGGEETEELKHFFNTGENLYHENKEAITQGGDMYLTACSGCHGHHAEGKLGPALGDDYWTYPKNATDKGLFETMYGGATAMMGPQYKQLTLDEMLKVIAWIRSVYWGSAEKAAWLTEEQKKDFEPAHIPKDYLEALKKFEQDNK